MNIQHNFQAAKKLLDDAQNIILTTHERTDGDDLGTVMALYHALIKQGKNPVVVIKGGVPPQLSFLPNTDRVLEIIPAGLEPDLIVFSGCSLKERCDIPELINAKVDCLNFDHHLDSTNYATVNVVDPDKSAVAELLYDYFLYTKEEITPQMATCLLTGMFTDTGSFMHSNTKNSTFRAAAHLLKLGASLSRIANSTFRGKSTSTLRAWGSALENTYFDPIQQIIYAVITEEELKKLPGLSLSSFEGFVETLNKVPEAKVALFLKQDGVKIKGSLRSDPFKGVDVQKIARLLGGGGHRWASGFSLVGKLERNPNGSWAVR